MISLEFERRKKRRRRNENVIIFSNDFEGCDFIPGINFCFRKYLRVLCLRLTAKKLRVPRFRLLL